MNRNFRLFFGLFIFLVMILGGLAIVRLFSWKSLLGTDRFFYCFASFLFVFGLFLSFLFSRFDDAFSVKKEVIVPKNDSDLVELREELHKFPREPVDSPKPIPQEVRIMTDDVSMYVEKRNILKPDDKSDDNEYSGVF